MNQTKAKITKTQDLIRTTDHWNIAVYRYQPAEVKFNYPVFLLHGISSSHDVFDLAEDLKEVSFAYHLAELGFDVFSIDLRGRPGSDGPHTGRGSNWSIDDYLLCDLPATVEYILDLTGKEQTHWVGHSLGGILGYFYQIRHKTQNLKSLTTFATSLTYTFSTINHFRTYLDYVTVLPNFPIAEMWQTARPLIDFDLPWNRFLWHPENLTPEVKRALLKKAVHRIGVFEWNQIKTISSAEGMPRITGGNHHYITDRRIRTPVLILAGDKDWVCPLDGVEWTSTNLKVDNQLVVFGKDYGNQTSYGHMDLVCGIKAKEEVWPVATKWLIESDKA